MDINECIEFMKQKHEGQTRKQGTPYYMHPLQVSYLLKNKGFPIEYQIAGLFHDLIEDTDATYEDIINLSNEEVANAVKLVTKEHGYKEKEYYNRIKNNFMARMLKLADRVHNLSETYLTSKEFQEKYIKETEDYFLDLAKDTVFEEDLSKLLSQLKELTEEK